ncbi:MAG: M23 family metallopeptidase [Mariprofundaceae bacterium]|nr:M23 family metallopeptidase [Mariprofundaceae bacterium]
MSSKRFSLMLVPDQGRVRSLRISRAALFVSLFTLIGTLSLGAWGGWQLYHSGQKDMQIVSLKNQMEMAQSRYAEQAGELQSRIDSDRRQMAVYARNIGTIQARLARLDALGSKLVDHASLDSAEFNFGLQPAFGGPRLASADPYLDGLNLSIERLDARLADLDVQLAAVDYLMEQGREEQAARPHAWPTEHGWLSSNYGLRADPFTGERARHNGVDIANRFGAPVLAASRGIVTFAGKMKDFGHMVVVDHGYGYVTRYGHMSALAVQVGEEVIDGQLIGRVGSTGRSTGPHLHYEVHRFGHHMNPAKFLPRG